ncbi:hypothetical protein O6H91_01G119300 [Diphasiastrum complanatum]|uniref:Uncharacterized protein n=1 Tax=Diphasiastrum complanatum TaxID=34168 RepID=A0ACC2EV91_DIPCM|nr:hypothetical protein O6H91_01G119300 [Diphasiastrum complanatum]
MDFPSHSVDLTMPKPSSFGTFFDRVKVVNGRNSTSPQNRRSEIELKKSVKYMECLKNHAASIGGHALDGCGEFSPSGEEGTAEALKCAACDCHRNFHRREEEGEPSLSCVECQHLRRDREKGNGPMSLPPPQVPLDLSIYSAFIRPSLTALGSRHSDIDDMDASTNLYSSSSRVKKRFRTKFSVDQKDKMFCLAEKLGWRIHTHDEVEIDKMCTEIGVTRNVFKVWMHNNRGASNKKPRATSPTDFA